MDTTQSNDDLNENFDCFTNCLHGICKPLFEESRKLNADTNNNSDYMTDRLLRETFGNARKCCVFFIKKN